MGGDAEEDANEDGLASPPRMLRFSGGMRSCIASSHEKSTCLSCWTAPSRRRLEIPLLSDLREVNYSTLPFVGMGNSQWRVCECVSVNVRWC